MDKISSVFRSSSGLSSAADVVVNATGGGGGGGDEDSLCPSLSFKNRIIGCVACMGAGMIFSVLSWVCVFLADYVFFGVLFTLGNVCSIAGLLFLAGPMRQLRGMFSEGRWIATTVYLLTMVLTIVVAVVLHSGIAVILCCLVQFAAMWWYFLSYIPFARDAVRATITTVLR